MEQERIARLADLEASLVHYLAALDVGGTDIQGFLAVDTKDPECWYLHLTRWDTRCWVDAHGCIVSERTEYKANPDEENETTSLVLAGSTADVRDVARRMVNAAVAAITRQEYEDEDMQQLQEDQARG